MTKSKPGYKRKYAMAKHHAWAGSILLAILGAIRWFTDDTEWYQKDIIFIIAGIFIIIYILIALVFTYRFRSGLAEETPNIQQVSNQQTAQSNNSKPTLSPKEQEKIEKKKAKAESKRLKKLAKAQQKKEKKSS
jgi:preprotein translocase subunit SecF